MNGRLENEFGTTEVVDDQTESHASLLESYSRIVSFRHNVEVATICRAGTSEAPIWERSRPAIRELAAELGFDPEQVVELAGLHIDSPPEVRDKRIWELIALKANEFEEKMAEIPSSLDKAAELLRCESQRDDLTESDVVAYVSRSAAVTNPMRNQIADRWFAEWQEYRSRIEGKTGLYGEKFWTSLDFQDRFDDVAYLRVYESWGLDSLDGLFESVVAENGFSIIDTLQFENPFGAGYSRAGTSALAFATGLWILSTSDLLRNRHRDLLGMAAVALHAKRESSEPAWVGPDVVGADHPLLCSETTALAIAASLRIGLDDRLRGERRESALWLLGAQVSDGFWTDWRGEPSIIGTAAAVYALRRTGIDGVQPAINRAITWLIEAQSSFGTWTEKGIPPIFLTSSVLDFVCSDEHWVGNYPQLASGVDMVKRGWALASEDSEHGRQLAVIAIFTGLETVLYALLQNEKVGVEIYRDNGLAIGFNDALNALRDWFRERDLIGSESFLPGSVELRGLKTIRDGVVHHGNAPSNSDLQRCVKGSRKLVDASARGVLQIDPLAA